ncbi:MAG: tetratricopeptide repeat protein [Planctomycetes bacterium]|nr:tetratricopeptide repeat protein [Planctomycetota bacterium]
MKEDTSFGARPERLRRLFALGIEDADESAPAPAVGSWGLSAEQPGSRIGRYRLLRVLGEGGMGIVYLAEQEHPIQRQVALKVIKPGMDSQRIVARFEAERQTLALLDHPNIAHVLDAGTTEAGRLYFVMEYVQGLPITEHCDRDRVSIEGRLALFGQVCDAIQHAHEKGVIHRDLKPSNILVVVQGGTAVPKIIDFGVARALSRPLAEGALMTEENQLVGTPEYMSPEQVRGGSEAIDVRSDVYSLGVLLYVLLTGALPFDPETLRQGGPDTVRRVLLEEDPKTPSRRLAALGAQGESIAGQRDTEVRTLAKRLHRELEWIPLKAMAKDRERRYRSAAALASDIRSYLNGAPLLAGPPSRSYRIRKFVRRNRTLVAAATVVALALAAGAVVSLTMYVRAQVQAQRQQAVSDLLNNTVLAALDPTRRQGGEITVLSVLDGVSDALEGRFTDAPLMEAEIRHRLGMTYYRQGAHDVGARHLQRALDLRRQYLGEDDLATIDSLFELGNVHRRRGHPHEGQPLLLEAVARRTRLLGEAHDKTLYAKTILATNCVALGRHGEALRLCQEVLETARRAGGEERSAAILAAYRIGTVHALRGNYPEAERWIDGALRSARRVLGEDHSWRGTFTDALGWVYLLQGRFAQSEQLLTEAVSHESRVFGAAHPYTLLSVETLVGLYVAWDRPEEASKWRARLAAAKSADAGSLAGSLHHDAQKNAYAIRGCGMDIYDVFDEFHFAHKTLRGDGSITARVDQIQNTDSWAKTGVMIRRTLDPTSEHASVFITPTGVVTFHYRQVPRGAGFSRHGAVGPVALPHRVRLTRRGATFTAEHSADGVAWQEVRSGDPNQSGPVEIAMDEAVRVGLAVTSHHVGRVAEAHVSGVALTGVVAPEGPFTLSEDIGLQTITPSQSRPVRVP